MKRVFACQKFDFNPARREISTLRWTKLRRWRRKFKLNFKYIKIDQILRNSVECFIKPSFSFFTEKSFNMRRALFDRGLICCRDFDAFRPISIKEIFLWFLNALASIFLINMLGIYKFSNLQQKHVVTVFLGVRIEGGKSDFQQSRSSKNQSKL